MSAPTMKLGSVEHPYELGRDDYMDGVPADQSPYAADSDEAVEWERGWKYEQWLRQYNRAALQPKAGDSQ